MKASRVTRAVRMRLRFRSNRSGTRIRVLDAADSLIAVDGSCPALREHAQPRLRYASEDVRCHHAVAYRQMKVPAYRPYCAAVLAVAPKLRKILRSALTIVERSEPPAYTQQSRFSKATTYAFPE